MRKLTIVPLIAIAALLAIPALASSASAATITIGDNFYSPSSKTVGVGTRVNFDWTGKKKHNVFKKSGPGGALPLGHDQEQGHQLLQDLQQARHLQADLHRPPEGNEADADGHPLSGSTSMLRSSRGAECVRAPTEIISTPVSAIPRTL